MFNKTNKQTKCILPSSTNLTQLSGTHYGPVFWSTGEPGQPEKMEECLNHLGLREKLITFGPVVSRNRAAHLLNHCYDMKLYNGPWSLPTVIHQDKVMRHSLLQLVTIQECVLSLIYSVCPLFGSGERLL